MVDAALAGSVTDAYEMQYLSVYYPYDFYTLQTEESIYDGYALLADVGGAMGLALGCCLFTILEIFDYLLFRMCDRKGRAAAAEDVGGESSTKE